ncbi:redoxin domain-containing protein [Halomicrobium katesii]|uniref:redoxin domain-containing protein n=1 Tax=Halomicrobium katesii TaxID=437163 RepID=UPI000365FBA9|nr:redoxin domain-containing protein [Halomicrobium katesii]
MSKCRVGRDESIVFTLPDASVGGEKRRSETLAREHERVLVVLLRSHYCPLSREIVQSLRDEYGSFASRSTAVVAVLPDSVERGAVWQRRYELPFSVLADPGESESGDDEAASSSPSFGTFEPYADYLQSLPGGALFRTDGDELRLIETVGTDGRQSFPSIEELLSEIESHDRGETGQRVGPRADTYGRH